MNGKEHVILLLLFAGLGPAISAGAAVGTAGGAAGGPGGTAGGGLDTGAAQLPGTNTSAQLNSTVQLHSIDQAVGIAGFLPSGSEGARYDWSRAGYAGGERGIPSTVGVKAVNVKDFGAKGKGASLEDKAVQAALKAVLKKGGVLYFPSGTYLLSQPLYANVSNVLIRGAGRGRTKLVFTRALADVYKAQWGVDECTGGPYPLWAFAGAFVMFDGVKFKPATPKQLAKVVVPSGSEIKMGTTRLPVSSTSGFKKGQWVVLLLNDESTVYDPEVECENRKAVYNMTERAEAASVGGGYPQLVVRQPPKWVLDDGIFRLAVAAAQARGGERENGLSVAQAASIDARHAAAMGRAGAAMANPGTVAAYLYGENVANSGGPGAIDTNSVRMAFRVKSIGSGYIEADRPLILTVKPKWNATVVEYWPGIQKVGVEDLTITFNQSGRYEGHFSDRGYNAIHITNAANGWVRRVQVDNADTSVFVTFSDFMTVSDVVTTSNNRTTTLDNKHYNGHHGIMVVHSQSVLVTRFNITARLWHDISVDMGASLGVYSNGEGVDLNLDNHRGGPYANLFSNITLGANTRPFYSGGRKDRGANAARGSTFWNLRPGKASNSSSVKLPKCDFGALLTFVLPKRSGSSCPASLWKVSTWTASKPVDLHQAQVDLRKKEAATRAAAGLPL